jgi:hypothetical protein
MAESAAVSYVPRKKLLFAVVAIFAILLVVSEYSPSISFAQSQSFATPINISNDSGTAIYPWVAISGSNVYVAWTEGSAGVYFRSSPNSGASWNPPLTSRAMKIGPGGSFPIISASGSYVYVVWADGGRILFAASSNDGTSFSAAKSVSSGVSGTAITPFDSSNGANVYVSFVLDNGSYVTWSNNGGSTFSTPLKFSSDHEAQIATAGSDTYALSDGSGGVLTSTNNGASWKKETKGIGGCCGSEPWIFASGSNVVAAWETKGNESKVIAITSTNSGASWKKTTLSTSTPDAWAPMPGIVGNTMYVAWRTNPGTVNSQEYLSISTNGGSKWSAPMAIGFAGKDNEWPFTVAVSGSNVYVFWAYADTATDYSSNGGASWSGPLTVSTSTTQIVREQDIATGAAAISGSTGFFVWQGTNSQIYFTSGTG